MRVIINDIMKVWKAEISENKADVSFSVSRKVREDDKYDAERIEKGIAKNGYVSTQFYATFVGEAFRKIKDLAEGTRIVNARADFKREPYWNQEMDCVDYPKSGRWTIFDFELVTDEYFANLTRNNNNTKTKEVRIEETTAPVKPVASKEENKMEVDDLPF